MNKSQLSHFRLLIAGLHSIVETHNRKRDGLRHALEAYLEAAEDLSPDVWPAVKDWFLEMAMRHGFPNDEAGARSWLNQVAGKIESPEQPRHQEQRPPSNRSPRSAPAATPTEAAPQTLTTEDIDRAFGESGDKLQIADRLFARVLKEGAGNVEALLECLKGWLRDYFLGSGAKTEKAAKHRVVEWLRGAYARNGNAEAAE